jgi:tripartite-type tricarboxylate transporter receptor subunit TctC
MSVSVLRIGIVFAALTAVPAAAETVADFYNGKQLKIIVRAGPGGSYDIYSRLLGRHIVNHIPGNPTAVAVNMPGGGGIKAFNYVANVAPKDGTVLTMVTQSFPLEQALGINKNLNADLRTLNWIGNMSDSNQVVVTWHTSPTKTLEDAKRRETVIGATGVGSTSSQLTAFYNYTLGTKFKLIYGYPSSPEINLAMERGEAEGRSTSTPQIYLPPGKPPLANFLIQTGTKKLEDLPDVPLLLDLAKTPEERALFDFISKASSIARPIAAAGGIPPERVEALRRAFDATFSDPTFIKEANAQSLEVSLTKGEDLQQFVADMVNAPRDILEKVREAIQVRSAEAIKGAKTEGRE